MLNRLLKYSDKIFKLRQHFQKTSETRKFPVIPIAVYPATLYVMFSARICSFNELDQHRDNKSWKRWLGHAAPSSDSIAEVSEKISTNELRDYLGEIYHTLGRNKVLQPINGWRVAIVDGHEIGCSYHRSGEGCLSREIEVGGEKKTQYYYRFVAIQIISDNGYQFFIDMEMQRPGDDEVAAALRLIERVLDNHPRCFDVLLTDAIYLRPSTIKLLRSRNKHLLSVLKKNQPELLNEARTLMESMPPTCVIETTKGGTTKTCSVRDMAGFTTETITEPLRVVWSHEVTIQRQRVGGEWQEKTTESDWFWATTMDEHLANSKTTHKLGHYRWRIENEGFNELGTYWNADHYYHHHANSIEVLWLILFMAQAIFHCFHMRNLKAELKRGHTVIYFGRLMEAAMRTQDWWPPAAPAPP